MIGQKMANQKVYDVPESSKQKELTKDLRVLFPMNLIHLANT